jgi:uncharacterized membrane protein YcaP (DUF421 family)
MKPEEIHITDFMRILQGEVPWGFLIEVVIRIFFIYFLLLLSMRLMGKRMASTLNRNELAALVSLAAGVGMALQSPERGLLPAIIICLVVVGIQRLISFITVRNTNFEKLSQGKISILIEEGRLNLLEMKKCLLSRERIFAQLRSSGIVNLGKVQRMYMETSGAFSIIQYENDKKGLSIVPEWDEEFLAPENLQHNVFACNNCGNLKNSSIKPNSKCEQCKETNWVMAAAR